MTAAQRFLESMNIDYEKWHDGVGYDMEALDEMPEPDKREIERMLLSRGARDWRDIEALAQLDTPPARVVIQRALDSSDQSVRMAALRYSAPQQEKKTQVLVDALEHAVLYGGLTQAMLEVETFHPPAVIDALLRGAMRRDGEIAVHFAAMLYFLHGKAKSSFDWDHRPFFLQFNEPLQRAGAFRRLCEDLGVDAAKYL